MGNAFKTFTQWFVYGVLVLAAAAIMILGQSDSELIDRARARVSDAFAPILEIMARPAAVSANVAENIRAWIDVGKENARLREERSRLLLWQTVAQRLEGENASLRKLLHAVPEPEATFLTARVIADSGGAFAQSLLLNAGSLQGVRKGDAVLNGRGLIGRIASVSERASRVLLVTDLNSRIPVVVGVSRARAVVAGDNSSQLTLIHLEAKSAVAEGDWVTTSGQAGVFPPGLPVGIVRSVSADSHIVSPFLRRSELDYVRVVDYGLAQLFDEMRPGQATSPRPHDGPSHLEPKTGE